MPKKTHGLGRGLDALLPEEEQDSEKGIALINIDTIDPNPEQPRKEFSKESLESLAQSIQSQGILQPILVVRNGERYTIVAGERRWRAAREADVREIPCIVKELDERTRMEIALVENLQREDLNPMEEAQGVRLLMDRCSLTQEDVAQRLGRSRPAVANLLRLLSLPEEIQNMVRDGRLSAGHARVLAGLEDRESQLQLAQTAIDLDYTVRQMEDAAAAMKNPVDEEKKEKKKPKELSAELAAFQTRLQETTGIRATLKGSENKGKIILQYYSREELEHLHEILERMQEGN